MEFRLPQGAVSRIEPADWPLVSPYTWNAKLENGRQWHAWTTIIDSSTDRKVVIKTYCFITGAQPGEMVDHEEPSKTLNDRQSTLRVCSNAKNQPNTTNRGCTQFNGVSWSARKRKWLVEFRHDGRYHVVGYFLEGIEVANAYDRMILPLAVEFAHRNAVALSDSHDTVDGCNSRRSCWRQREPVIATR